MRVIRVLVYEGEPEWIGRTLSRSAVKVRMPEGPNPVGGSISELFVDPYRVEEGIQCCDIHDRCVSRDQLFDRLDAQGVHFKLEE